jgi:MoxR-like ATPase
MTLFDDYNHFIPWVKDQAGPQVTGVGPDDRSGWVYLHDPKLQLCAEIAIVTQRPLLISGQPGSGKSSFAPFIASILNWRYYGTTITGSTEAKDLLWKFDALARLRDAQAKKNIDPSHYVTPGVLWWAFNRKDAKELMSKRKVLSGDRDSRGSSGEPFAEINRDRDEDRTVILIDEIDKAEPDLPNDLLEVFGLNRFIVDELDRPVKRIFLDPDDNIRSPNHFGSMLIIITTNQERDLPAAFMRRCVVYAIEEPKEEAEQIERLTKIAKLHMPGKIESHSAGEELVKNVAEKCYQLRQDPEQPRGPSTAEFLDALRVCFDLNITPKSMLWGNIEECVFKKENKLRKIIG